MTTGVREAGARVEELLGGLQTGPAKAAAEELVSVLVDLYGEGLARTVAVVRDGAPELLDKLAADPLVESLLLLHGLHPLDADARVQRALDRVRPYLGSHAGGVEYLGIDEAGVAHLRLAGSCDGCPSSALTVQLAIEGAVQDAAPEVTAIEVEGVTTAPEPALLQIGFGPPGADAHSPAAAAESSGGGSGWTTLPDFGPPTGRPTVIAVDGTSVLVCSIRGTLYAYRDSCAACGESLAKGTMDGDLLACPACGRRYDVRLAGKGRDDPSLHLDPLPLLADSRGVRVALPKAVAS